MIDISWIIDLVSAIPDILLYIVEGYIFVSVYNFILFKDNSEHYNLVMTKSIAISFVMKSVYDFAVHLIFGDASRINSAISAIILCVAGAGLGYLLARIVMSDRFNYFLLHFLKIRRTVKKSVWENVIKRGSFVRVFSRDGKSSYFGQCSYVEEHTREPLIVLNLYEILDENGVVIDGCDYLHDSSRSVVLNLSEFERVDVIQSKVKENSNPET